LNFFLLAGGAGAGGQAAAQDCDAQLAACRRDNVPDDGHPPPLTRHRSEIQVPVLYNGLKKNRVRCLLVAVHSPHRMVCFHLC
jgi:hypothetical protein